LGYEPIETDEDLGNRIADVEFIENHIIQQISIAVARGMNNITDYPNIKYEIKES